jgi:outer membrane protein assembly factor BamA
MSKKRSKTSDFSLELGTKKTGNLPTKEEIEKTIAKAVENVVEKEEAKVKRIPFTTALTPENRATLEAAAHEGKESVADLLNIAINYYFEQVRPLEDHGMKEVFLKIFEKKVK